MGGHARERNLQSFPTEKLVRRSGWRAVNFKEDLISENNCGPVTAVFSVFDSAATCTLDL